MFGNFVSAVELAKGADLSYTPSVKELNQALLKRGVLAGEANSIEFRVQSSVEASGIVNSDILTLNLTAYEDQVGGGEVDPIYMLGGGTTAGWDNNDGNIVAYYQPISGADSTYAAVDLLTPAGEGDSDGFIKFVRYIGVWAPQWGSDDAGTWESGREESLSRSFVLL